MAMTAVEIESKFMDLLCSLFRRWGFQCNNLGKDPTERGVAVNAYYRTNGPPPVAEHEDTLKILNDLDLLLAEPANPLDAVTSDLIHRMIVDLRLDCGP